MGSDINQNTSYNIEYSLFQLHVFNDISLNILSIHKTLNESLLCELICIKFRNNFNKCKQNANVFNWSYHVYSAITKFDQYGNIYSECYNMCA